MGRLRNTTAAVVATLSIAGGPPNAEAIAAPERPSIESIAHDIGAAALQVSEEGIPSSPAVTRAEQKSDDGPFTAKKVIGGIIMGYILFGWARHMKYSEYNP